MTVEEFWKQIGPTLMAQLRARHKVDLALMERLNFRGPVSTPAEGLTRADVAFALAFQPPQPTYVISPFTQMLVLCPETGAVYDRHEAQERLFWLVGEATTAGDALAEAYIRQIGDLVRAMRQLKEEDQ